MTITFLIVVNAKLKSYLNITLPDQDLHRIRSRNIIFVMLTRGKKVKINCGLKFCSPFYLVTYSFSYFLAILKPIN